MNKKQIIELIKKDMETYDRLAEKMKNDWLENTNRKQSEVQYRIYQTWEGKADALSELLIDIKKGVKNE